jgi:hypothetical protein
MRYQSRLELYGVPLLPVALGPGLASHQARGVARGVIAVGDIGVYPEGGAVIRVCGR